MKLKLHRVLNGNGGSCLEVWTENSRLVLDIGLPLVGNADPGDSQRLQALSTRELVHGGMLPDIPALFESGGKAAVLVSRTQPEHDSLADFINESCPVYIGKMPKWLLSSVLNFIFRRRVSRLRQARGCESNHPFQFGDFTITPFLVDRSAFDAFAFLIESDGKKLLYSGDLRNYGYSTHWSRKFLETTPTNVDCLVLENDAFGRTAESLPTESEIEKEFSAIFNRAAAASLVYISGQNIDRLVSIYRACQKCKKTLVMDLYLATVFTRLTSLGVDKKENYDPDFTGIKVWHPQRTTALLKDRQFEEYPFKLASENYKYSREKIMQDAKNLVILVRPAMLTDLEGVNILTGNNFLRQATLIHSLWQGYQKRSETRNFIDNLTKHGLTEIKYIHTSGYANLAVLRKMLEALRPQKVLLLETTDRYSAVAADFTIVQCEANQEIEV